MIGLMPIIPQLGRGFGTTDIIIPTAPAAPSILASVDNGVIIVSVVGDVGATHTLLTKRSDEVEWTTAGTLTGDGDITITDVSVGAYQILAYSSISGAHSTPSNLAVVTLSLPVGPELPLKENMLKRGQDMLTERLLGIASSTIIYKQGTVAIECDAVVGKTRYQATTEDGYSVEANAIDFLVKKKSLEVDEMTIEPKQGDRIEMVNGVYEVMYLPGEGCWRYSDPFGTLYRIHTKKVEG